MSDTGLSFSLYGTLSGVALSAHIVNPHSVEWIEEMEKKDANGTRRQTAVLHFRTGEQAEVFDQSRDAAIRIVQGVRQTKAIMEDLHRVD